MALTLITCGSNGNTKYELYYTNYKVKEQIVGCPQIKCRNVYKQRRLNNLLFNSTFKWMDFYQENNLEIPALREVVNGNVPGMDTCIIDDRLLSVRFMIVSNIGYNGDNTSNNIYELSYIVDLDGEKELSFDELFVINEDFIHAVEEDVQPINYQCYHMSNEEAIKNWMDTFYILHGYNMYHGSECILSEYCEKYNRDISRKAPIYLSDDGVVFMMHTATQGSSEYYVPYSALYEYMNETYFDIENT